ncbi:MAG: Ig-like domain-containing protein [Reichenbachiella sp.]|uniref:Ig-like domain-containing protein n=1 Tax=Reichenbachiella sp. TaxID=2184521 RepID=UPI00326795F7
MNRIVNILTIFIILQGCVGTDVIDDIIEEKIEITTPIASLKVGESYSLMHRYLNNTGMEEDAEVDWFSTDQSVLEVTEDGELTALMSGQSEITVVLRENNQIMDKILIEAAEETVVLSTNSKSGTINTTSSYELTGDFEITNTDTGVRITISDNYIASSALPGLYVYLSNNPSTTTGALEIQAVSVFSGEHAYEVDADELTVDTYVYLLYFCKPFNVKVGHGEILD